jgi:ubiquitin-like protein ATG12
MKKDCGTTSIEDTDERRNISLDSTDVNNMADLEIKEDTMSEENIPSLNNMNSMKEQMQEDVNVQGISGIESDATIQLKPSLLGSDPSSPSSSYTTRTKSIITSRNDDTMHPPAVSCSKVKVHFVAVGNAPILKKSKFKIDPNVKFGYVINSLRRTLSLDSTTSSSSSPAQPKSSLFLYCNAAFVSSPDERLGDLNDCFSIRGELVIHNSLKEAWG